MQFGMNSRFGGGLGLAVVRQADTCFLNTYCFPSGDPHFYSTAPALLVSDSAFTRDRKQK